MQTDESDPLPKIVCGGVSVQVANVTLGFCAATITTRYEAIGHGNILTLAHYPMSVVLYEFGA